MSKHLEELIGTQNKLLAVIATDLREMRGLLAENARRLGTVASTEYKVSTDGAAVWSEFRNVDGEVSVTPL